MSARESAIPRSHDSRDGGRSVLVARTWNDAGFNAGLLEVANEFGWRVTMLDRHEDQHWYLPRRIDGAITIIDEMGRNHELIPVLNRFNAPVVNGADTHPPGLQVPVARVLPDHVAIGRLAARHLAEAGHQHLAFYAWSSNEAAQLRRKGFTDEAKRLGCAVVPFPSHDLSDLGWLRSHLEEAPIPLAVFAVCDELAALLCDAVLELGKLVPEHLAIMGVNNDAALCVNNRPPLTSIDTAQWEQGRQSALELDRLMRGEPPPKHPLIIAPLIACARQSSLLRRPGSDGVRIALDFLRKHVAEPDALDSLPEALGASRSSIYRMFQRAGLGPPAQLQLRLRIEHAQHLLATTKLPLKEISELAGLQNAPRLCRVFSKQVGLTPKQYRQGMRS